MHNCHWTLLLPVPSNGKGLSLYCFIGSLLGPELSVMRESLFNFHEPVT